jgi:hypothetical protein
MEISEKIYPEKVDPSRGQGKKAGIAGPAELSFGQRFIFLDGTFRVQ